MRRFLALLLSTILAVLVLPAFALADTGDATKTSVGDISVQTSAGTVANGTWGTCPWDISDDGVLTVYPGVGANYGKVSPWYDHGASVKKVVFRSNSSQKVIAPSSVSFLLSGASRSMKEVDLSGLDTSNVTDMSNMFDACEALTSLDVSSLNTSNVTDMWGMFAGCSALSSLNLSGFNTSKVKDMYYMFQGCTSLTSLDLSSFNTSNVTNTVRMFMGCDQLASLDLSSFDTSKVNNDHSMFLDCPKLASIKVGSRTMIGIALPDAVVEGTSAWHSTKDGGWYTSAQISADRQGVADTYTKSGAATIKVMYRLYNPNSGEHFYTADAGEYESVGAAGWDQEGVAWIAPKSSNTPVYRLYSGTDHHYTPDAAERDHLLSVGWKDEGIGWYSDDAKGVGLHRLFNPHVDPSAATNNSGSHHYTISAAERDNLVQLGWIYENIGWYGCK